MTFKLAAWWATTVFGGCWGMADIETQGDEWDAQNDIALASVEAIIAMLSTAMLNMYLQRNIAQEWA